MSKRRSNYSKRPEVWQVRNPKTDPKVTDPRVAVTKIAVRVEKGKTGPNGQRPGTFGGATNFRQSL